MIKTTFNVFFVIPGVQGRGGPAWRWGSTGDSWNAGACPGKRPLFPAPGTSRPPAYTIKVWLVLQCSGSGSESGSGSTRSTCFWASWIRIRIHLSEVWIQIRLRILLSSCKNSKKKWRKKHGSADPDQDPLQNVMDPEHWFCFAKSLEFGQLESATSLYIRYVVCVSY
jgi:hypothetical protein